MRAPCRQGAKEDDIWTWILAAPLKTGSRRRHPATGDPGRRLDDGKRDFHDEAVTSYQTKALAADNETRQVSMRESCVSLGGAVSSLKAERQLPIQHRLRLCDSRNGQDRACGRHEGFKTVDCGP